MGPYALAGLPGPEVKAASVVTLACSPVLFQDSVHIIYFTQSLEERDEIEQLCVGHVIEPGCYRHLEGQGGAQERELWSHDDLKDFTVNVQMSHFN